MEIVDKIEKAHYVIVSDHEVELLAAAHLAASEATKKTDGAYLRILVAACQAELGNKKHKMAQKDQQRHAEYLSEVHGRLYPAVMRGVTTPDVEDDEKLSQDDRRARAAIRNARATFARSGASTIQGYIKAGGDVRGLDVQTVTKYFLQTFIASKAGDTPKMEMVMAALQRVEKQVMTWVQEDPDQARAALEECMARLQRLLDDLPHVIQAPEVKTQKKAAIHH
jgi:hypothetical protein